MSFMQSYRFRWMRRHFHFITHQFSSRFIITARRCAHAKRTSFQQLASAGQICEWLAVISLAAFYATNFHFGVCSQRSLERYEEQARMRIEKEEITNLAHSQRTTYTAFGVVDRPIVRCKLHSATYFSSANSIFASTKCENSKARNAHVWLTCTLCLCMYSIISKLTSVVIADKQQHRQNQQRTQLTFMPRPCVYRSRAEIKPRIVMSAHSVKYCSNIRSPHAMFRDFDGGGGDVFRSPSRIGRVNRARFGSTAYTL